MPNLKPAAADIGTVGRRPYPPEVRCRRCSRILIRGYSLDACPECVELADREVARDEEDMLRCRLHDPYRWDAILAQDKRTLAFCRERLRSRLPRRG